MKYKFGFIGCGNMGGALAQAVAKSVDPLTRRYTNEIIDGK